MWVILSYIAGYVSSAAFIVEEDGTPMVFSTEDDAIEYAEEVCAYEYKVLRLDQ